MDLFIQPSQQGGLEAPFSILHNTLGRDIVMFKNGQQITIATSPEHNFIWEGSPTNDQVQIIPVSGVFKARIKYNTNQNRNQLNSAVQGKGSDQVNVEIENGDVRLKLDSTGAAFIKDATRVVLDGDVFNIESPKRPHGLFQPQFFDFTLKRLN